MSETRVLADFLKNTEPPKAQGKEETRNFFSKLLSPKKKKNPSQSIATPQKGEILAQTSELRSPIREPGQFSSFEHIRPQSAEKKKKRKTLLPDQMSGSYQAPSPNMPLMSPMNDSPRSHSPEEEDTRRPAPQQSLNGISSGADMLPTPPNASPAVPRPISKQASLMPPELNLEDGRQKPETGNLLKSSGQNKSAARSKYRKSKFPEQMLAQMSIEYGEEQEEPQRQMPKENEETKQFHFIDDDLLRAINNLGTSSEDPTEISSRPILTNEIDVAPIDLPQAKEKGRRQRAPQKLRKGEQLVQELNLEKSMIVNGGALKKNYSEKKNVKFSGYDQIIPNIPPEELMRMIQMESNQRELFYQQSRSQTRTPSPTPDGKAPLRSSSNKARQQHQQSHQQQMYQPQPRRHEEMQPRHAPNIPSPLKQRSSPMNHSSASLESKALPLAPEPSLPIAMLEVPPPPPALETRPMPPNLEMLHHIVKGHPVLVSPPDSETSAPRSPQLPLSHPGNEQGPERAQSPVKRKVKRRHIQLQTRLPERIDVGIQVESTNEFDDMTKELEQELLVLRETNAEEETALLLAGEKNAELQLQVDTLSKELEETKEKLESISDQAVRKMQSLMEENQLLMIELSTMRAHLAMGDHDDDNEPEEDVLTSDELTDDDNDLMQEYPHNHDQVDENRTPP